MISILIPSKNEKYLAKTVQDIFQHAEGDVEVFVGLDGWTDEIPEILATKIIKHKTSIGQRAMTNELARLSTAKYIMKTDAHCSFSQGFDLELVKAMDDKTIMAPYLLKLDAENWEPLPQTPSASFAFDTDLVFQYNREAENQELITETMCLQGSAWMITRENYWKWNICDETLGSWGGQGAELGIRAFLNGGACKVNKNCYYAHLFREKEEDFPYQRNKAHIMATLQELRKRYKKKSIAPLIEKYNYPANWTKENVADLSTE